MAPRISHVPVESIDERMQEETAPLRAGGHPTAGVLRGAGARRERVLALRRLAGSEQGRRDPLGDEPQRAERVSSLLARAR